MAKSTDIKVEVKKELGNVGDKKLRYVSWNGNEPKFDLRSWYTDKDGNEKCNKGITLTKEELETLYNLIPEAIKALEKKPTKSTKSK